MEVVIALVGIEQNLNWTFDISSGWGDVLN